VPAPSSYRQRTRLPLAHRFKSEGVIPFPAHSCRSAGMSTSPGSISDERSAAFEGLVLQKRGTRYEARPSIHTSNKIGPLRGGLGQQSEAKQNQNRYKTKTSNVKVGRLEVRQSPWPHRRHRSPKELILAHQQSLSKLRRVRDPRAYVAGDSVQIIELRQDRTNVVLSAVAYLEEAQLRAAQGVLHY